MLTRSLIEMARAECERQHVGPDRVVMLLDGWAFALEQRSGYEVPRIEHLLRLAVIVEPETRGRFRKIPVVFREAGMSAASHDVVPDAIERLFGQFEFATPPADEFVRAYLSIHPFIDGNGRTAWVLYNWIGGTMEDPLPLPYFDWSGDTALPR